jgi:hypothetical protein
VLKLPAIRVAAEGKKYTSKAIPITDPAKVRDVVEKFRAKYGDDDMAYYSKLDVAVEVPLS